eukprot:4209038-Pleurochrysis_carterae.AAC.2
MRVRVQARARARARAQDQFAWLHAPNLEGVAENLADELSGGKGARCSGDEGSGSRDLSCCWWWRRGLLGAQKTAGAGAGSLAGRPTT